MKITLLISSLSGGGAERVVCNLANYLCERGHDVTILTVSDQKTYHLKSEVRHIVLYGETNTKLPHILVNIIRLMRMNKYFRKEVVDVYVTFLPQLTKLILLQKCFINAPIIMAERGNPESFISRSKKNESIFTKYYPKADGYFFQTEDARNFYKRKGINISKSVVIPNAINVDFIKDVYQGERKKVIVGAGRLSEQKNFSLLINAFYEICNEFPDYSLRIYGEGPLKEKLLEQISSLNLENKIILKGYVSNLGNEIQDASLFVLSSDFEGMPNALMEAMALGIPSISTDCPAGGSAFLIEDNINGILVPVGDITSMSNAMRVLLSDSEKMYNIGKNAELIKQKLEPSKIYKRWEEFIDNIVNGDDK